MIGIYIDTLGGKLEQQYYFPSIFPEAYVLPNRADQRYASQNAIEFNQGPTSTEMY